MKKLITLLLVLTGMVCTASAATKRIYLKAENGWARVDIHLYKGSDNITGTWPGLNLKRIGSTQWFYGDVDSDVTNARCIVSSNGWGQTLKGQDPNYYEIDLSKNNAIYLYNDGSGSDYDKEYKNKLSITTFTGYVIANGYTVADNTLVTLTQDGLKLTGTLDLSSEDSDVNFWVFPQILSSSTYYVGNVAIAPDDNLTLSSFAKYQDDISLGDTYKWTESAHQKYDVEINLETGKFTFTPYFERTLPAAAEGYATFSSTYDVIPDENLTAVQYASAVNTTTGKITWEDYPGTGIKAGEGALLTGTAGETYKFTPATSAVAPTTNLLKAIPSATLLTGSKYILAKPSTHVGFYKVNQTTGSYVNSGTAYLEPGATARDYFWIDDETTGIEAVNVNPETVKEGAREYYNLNGQRVMNPSKGLYIVNGKKVIIK